MNDQTMPRIQAFLLEMAHSPLPISDIHIEEDQPVVVKLPGEILAPIDEHNNVIGEDSLEMPITFSHDDIAVLLGLINPRWQDLLEMGRAVSEPLVYAGFRLRCNGYSINGGGGLAVSVRKQPASPPKPEQIGLPDYLVKATDNPKGLFLVTGPTGAGKTTTIASLLDGINHRRYAHIVTIEKPIEYTFKRRKAIFSQKEVGKDATSFTTGLEDALQQRPSVILIGEIRDRVAAEATLHASESGHLVFATLHASSAEGALVKLLSFFPAESRATWGSLLSENLVAVIGQKLAPLSDKSGSILAAEILMNSAPVRKAIADGDFQRLRQIVLQSEDQQSVHMNTVLLNLVKDKKISVSDAMATTYDPASLGELFRKNG